MPKPAIIIAGLFGVFSLCLGCGSDPSAKPAGPPAFPVKVVSAQAQLVPQSTDYLATLKSRHSAVLQPQVEGDIVKIYVQAGQHVDAGTPILQIDPRKQEATVNNQEAARKSKRALMEQNRVDLERKKQLFAAGVISKADLDLAQSTYEASRADVEAPEAGIVGDIPVRVGDHVTNQTALTTLDRGDELEAYVYIPSEKSGIVRMGMPVDILDDS